MVSCDKIRRSVAAEKTAAAAILAVAFEATFALNVEDPTFLCSSCRTEATFAEILFNYCQHCSTMPALPQGAFAACKIRQQNDSRRSPLAKEQSSRYEQANGGAGGKPATPTDLFPKWKLIDLSPLKYNSKFMNAIWGHYNRYSPHNIKSNEANRAGASAFAARQQQ